MEARLTLEPKLASMAALRITVNDLDNLFTYSERSREVVATAEYEQWDSMLHSTIAKAASNGLLFSLFEMVNNARNDALWGRLKEASLTPERRKFYSQQHEELLKALKDRDANQAEELMRVHIDTVKGHLLGTG
jgi:GntR family uxuAB operon transcriptional repressor